MTVNDLLGNIADSDVDISKYEIRTYDTAYGSIEGYISHLIRLILIMRKRQYTYDN